MEAAVSPMFFCPCVPMQIDRPVSGRRPAICGLLLRCLAFRHPCTSAAAFTTTTIHPPTHLQPQSKCYLVLSATFLMVLDGSGCVSLSYPVAPGTPPEAASLRRPSWPLHSEDSVSSLLKRLMRSKRWIRLWFFLLGFS